MFRHNGRLLVVLLFKYYLIQLTSNGIAATDVYNVTRDECINANGSPVVQKLCCLRLDMKDEAAATCIHSLKPDVRDSDNEEVRLLKLSPIIACIYKKRKYIRSGTQLNMAVIKAEAKKRYQNDSVQKNYMIDLYKTCSHDATFYMERLRKTERGMEFIKKARYPYFLFVYVCSLHYSNAHCPYFRWKDDGKPICAEYADQCKKRFFENPGMYLRSLKNTTNE